LEPHHFDFPFSLLFSLTFDIVTSVIYRTTGTVVVASTVLISITTTTTTTRYHHRGRSLHPIAVVYQNAGAQVYWSTFGRVLRAARQRRRWQYKYIHGDIHIPIRVFGTAGPAIGRMALATSLQATLSGAGGALVDTGRTVSGLLAGLDCR
jgi:hypothetical protein